MALTIHNQNVLKWADGYDGPLFHAVLCDPPYHLISDVRNGSERQPGSGPYGRHKVSTKGFMNSAWDGGDVAFRPETWMALRQHLLPGAFGLAFASARGWHRMACAIEDAGFIIHPTIFGWNRGCVSSDTEILTNHGWKTWNEIDYCDFVVAFDKDTSEYKLQLIEQIYTYEYQDTAYAIKSDFTDQIVSKEHRCLVERDGKYIFQRADSLQSKESVPVLERGCTSQKSQPRGQRLNESATFCVQQRPQNVRMVRNTRSTLATVTPFDYNGIVWCVKVATGAFVARRNGQIFVTGNSGFPKGVKVKNNEDFKGHRYGLQAMKPALEPILLFQNPFCGKALECIKKNGTGTLNIDAARITYRSQQDEENAHNNALGPVERYKTSKVIYDGGKQSAGFQDTHSPLGRWPANFVLQHHPDCRFVGHKKVKGSGTSKEFHEGYQGESITGFIRGVSHPGNQHAENDGTETMEAWECHEDCSVLHLDRQSGNRPTKRCEKISDCVEDGKWGTFQGRRGARGYTDDGGASRFFYNANWNDDTLEHLDEADAVYYATVASRSERDAGLDGQGGSQRITPMAGRGQPGLKCKKCGKWKVSGNPCRCTEPEFEPSAFERPENFNIHCTVKPLSLCTYLSRLLSPPDKYAPRRLCVPFAGSGSEMIGALLSNGFEEIIGIEQDKTYCEIAKKRIEFWQKMHEKNPKLTVKEMLQKHNKLVHSSKDKGFVTESDDTLF